MIRVRQGRAGELEVTQQKLILIGHRHVASAKWAEQQSPVHLVLAGEHGSVDADRVKQVLQQRATPPVAEAHLPVIADLTLFEEAVGGSRTQGVTVAPVSGFNQWLSSLAGMEPLTVPEGHGVLSSFRDMPWGEQVGIGYAPDQPGSPLSPEARSEVGAEVTLLQAPEGLEVRRALTHGRFTNAVLIVDDGTFAALWQRFGAIYGITVHGYKVAQWRETGPVIRQLSLEIIASAPQMESRSRPFTGTWSLFDSNRRELGVFLFVFGFISVLFFLAAGNMLYFKLFGDLQDDRRQVVALHKLGIPAEGVTRILSAQTLVLFFAPLAVAVLHAVVILPVVGRLLKFPSNLWVAFLMVAGVYLVLHGAYFLVARRTYTQAVLSGR